MIAAGFGVYGVFTNRGDRTWRTEGAVIIEKGTGAVYVWRENKLHPALNLASAFLASSAAKPLEVRGVNEIAARACPGVHRRRAFPARHPAQPQGAGGPAVGGVFPAGQRLAGLRGGRGRQPSMGGRTVADDEAILVKSATRSTAPTDTYMLWRGRLYEARASVVGNLAPGVQPTVVSRRVHQRCGQGTAAGAAGDPGQGNRVRRRTALWKVGDVIRVTNFQEDRVRGGPRPGSGLGERVPGGLAGRAVDEQRELQRPGQVRHRSTTSCSRHRVVARWIRRSSVPTIASTAEAAVLGHQRRPGHLGVACRRQARSDQAAAAPPSEARSAGSMPTMSSCRPDGGQLSLLDRPTASSRPTAFATRRRMVRSSGSLATTGFQA